MQALHTPPASQKSTASSASQASLTSIQIGDGSFSPGDVFVEALLPRVRLGNQSSSLTSSKSNATLASLRDGSGYGAGGDRQSGTSDDVDVEPLGDHAAVRRAQQECATLLNGNAVSVLEDEDVKEDVVQITGHVAELVFPCRNIFQYLVLFVKDLEQFVEIYVDVLDEKLVYRQLKATNARSLVKVEVDRCQLPLVLGPSPGWRYVCLDLHDLTRRGFGTKHVTTVQVRVAGHCRLLRVFFQDEQYSDAELPPYLTFLG